MKRKGIILLYLIYLNECKQLTEKNYKDNNKAIYILVAFILMAIFACCMFIKQRFCPDEDMFTDIELEDIRLERVSDKERSILGKINQMKDKLVDLRKKKTTIATRRDITKVIEDRLESFNSKGRQIYGPAWDGEDGNLPVREMIKIPESEINAIRREAEIIATARKEEEKKDTWDIWNKIGSDLPEKTKGQRVKTIDANKPPTINNSKHSQSVRFNDSKLNNYNKNNFHHDDDDEKHSDDSDDRKPLLKQQSTIPTQKPPVSLKPQQSQMNMNQVGYAPSHISAPPRPNRPIVSKLPSGDYEINANIPDHRPVSRDKSIRLTPLNQPKLNQEYIRPEDLPLTTSNPPRPIGRKPPPPTDLPPPDHLTKSNRPAPPSSTISPPSQIMISPPKEAPPPSMMRRPMIRPPGGMAPPVLRRPNAPVAPNPSILNQLEHKED